MKGLIVYGSDKALAQFYYLVFQRLVSVQHAYRRDNGTCYTCNDEDGPLLFQVAEELNINYEFLHGKDKYSTVLGLVQGFDAGERITTRFLMERTGYTRYYVAKAMQDLIAAGHVESRSRTSGRYYCRA